MRVAVLGLVAACSSPAPVHLVDAGQGPIDYTLYVTFDGTRPDMPQIFIDGVETRKVHRVYQDFTAPLAHQIELRYAGHVLAQMAVGETPGACGPPDAVWSTIDESVQALVSGDLRYIGDQWWGDGHACTGDGFGIAHCFCDPTERCIPRIMLGNPLFTKMACAPIGPKAIGDPCTLIDDPAGAYDDCGANLICYQATCHALCATAIIPCTTTCVQPEGYPNEAAFCI